MDEVTVHTSAVSRGDPVRQEEAFRRITVRKGFGSRTDAVTDGPKASDKEQETGRIRKRPGYR